MSLFPLAKILLHDKRVIYPDFYNIYIVFIYTQISADNYIHYNIKLKRTVEWGWIIYSKLNEVEAEKWPQIEPHIYEYIADYGSIFYSLLNNKCMNADEWN